MADDAIVAIKIYAPEKGLDDYGVRQFRKEFSLTYHLSHPHLMKVNHFDICDGSPYLIMPYCAFGSLARVLEEGNFSERQVALVMCQIGSALEELHKQDPPILHQDIKPDNILVYQPECFLLADFGISSQIRHTLRKATSNFRSLTIAYAPPERFDRYPISDTSSDIFSFGVTLYEMCTNSIPWDGSGGQSLLKGDQIPRLPENFSTDLNQVLQECMAVDRSKRPSAAELHFKGKNFLETGQWKFPQKGEDNKKTSRRSKVPYLIAALIVVATLCNFWLYYNYKGPYSGVQYEKIATPPIIPGGNFTKELKDRIRVLEQRAVELEQANQRLRKDDSLNKLLLQNQKGLIASYEGQLAEKNNLLASARKGKKPDAGIEAKESFFTQAELQEYLNQISNPKIPKQVRTAWKQETIAQFADGAVKVLDDSDGTTKQYSASIFLNLLINVPHRIEVKEVERDSGKKITLLRLTMQPVK